MKPCVSPLKIKDIQIQITRQNFKVIRVAQIKRLVITSIADRENRKYHNVVRVKIGTTFSEGKMAKYTESENSKPLI